LELTAISPFIGGASHPTIPERIVTIRKLGPEPAFHSEEMGQSQTGTAQLNNATNLPNYPTQIAILKLGLEIKNRKPRSNLRGFRLL
jgi:hypothetical protein